VSDDENKLNIINSHKYCILC